MPHEPYGGRLDLSGVTKPVRYTGGELGSVVKAEARLRMAIAYPDVYEVGMSYIGLQILYDIINKQTDYACERVFAPWPDMEQAIRDADEPLRSLETDTALGEMDILGFSFQHDLAYTNFLCMLDLAGIPLRSSARSEAHPLVIAGGPCAYNPAPIADFVDAFVIGEAEDVILELLAEVLKAKESHTSRVDTLLELARIPGVFVPCFYERVPNRLGYLCFGEPTEPGIASVVRKRIVDFENSAYPTRQIIPNGRVIQHRLTMEIMRGCPRGCRFCQAGFTNRPVRERSVDRIQELTREGLAETGYDDVTLMSLSSGDYTRADALTECIMSDHEDRRVSVTLPSLRLDGFSENIPRVLERVSGGGLTFAPEAGTERLRKAVNKFISDEQIFDTISKVFNKNWETAKLYFMIGLPTETDEDVIGIADLAKRIRIHLDGMGWRRGRVHISVGTFSPKPHIPYQWYGQISEPEARRRIELIKKHIKHPKIKFNWHGTRPSRLEASLARGDIRLADVIETAFRAGARFDEWHECFQDRIWQEAFDRHELSYQGYASQEYAHDDLLPWDVISVHLNKRYLWHEWQRTFDEKGTFHCGNELCRVCGVCRDDTAVTVHTPPPREEPAVAAESEVREAEAQPATHRYRIAYEKTGPLLYASHQDLLSVLDAVLRRARLEMAYTRGFSPSPKVVFSSALSVGVEGLDEYLDVETTREYAPEALSIALSNAAPPGMHVRAVVALEDDALNVARIIHACRYQLETVPPTGWSVPPVEDLRHEVLSAEPAAVLETLEEEPVLEAGTKIRLNFFVERRHGNLPSAKRLIAWVRKLLGGDARITVRRTAQLCLDENGNAVPILPRGDAKLAREHAA